MKEKQSSVSFFTENGLYLAFGTALIATLGSLYFSEIREFIPCTFCWYQRILMYPLVLLLAIAAVKKDYRITIYTLPMSVLGIAVSLFHYLTQKVDLFKSNVPSCGIIPCNESYVNYFGFVTIPFMAFTAFMIITFLLIMTARAAKRQAA
ncbi:disulfide oxidoreductase [Marinicrinis lubricantis]|uniref:Disulfide oxidoreductase n=1 Tax=Marinicrinis lubricantis TaxID=2086470 RepID=A0ABW1IU13_9BACL